MGKKLVITIAREFGAEGHEIGKQLSERLGFSLYDKDMLSLAAQQRGIEVGELAPADENLIEKFLGPYFVLGKLTSSKSDELFKLQSDIIHNLGETGNCIIVGRLGDYILKDAKNCLKVFIYAPLEVRVDIIKNKHHIDEKSARRLVKKMDSARRDYYSYYSDGKWDRKESKDLMINRGVFSVEECVDLLEGAARKKIQEMDTM